ncbi:penicillin-binding protein activator [Sphingomonas sp. FW199]|uniref:penicillin-binding protein activator n=1 Tax=Sphingomonas sp. FW199 TaxID=3400217 RepID=UPI003CF2830F
MTTWFRLAAISLGLALAGCQVVPKQGPQQPGPVTRPRPVAPPPVTGGIPEDRERHRVALLVPLTGANAGVGQSLSNATTLALLDTNTKAVRITTYDTATGAAAAAQRAIADGNRLILGPLLAEDVRAVTPIARRAGVPVLSFSNDVSVAGNGAYVMGYSPDQSIERVVGFARQSGITSFAGLMPRGVYGERASTSFLRAVEGAGGRVVAMQSYDRSQASINAAVGRLNGASPFQAVLVADSSGTAALSIPAIRRGKNAGARLLGTELWNTDTGVAGNPALNGAWYASVSNGLYRTYATKYRTRFGAAPYRLSSLGYDAVLLTIRIAREWKVGTPFPEARLVSQDGFAGLDGAFRFGRNGVAERALEVQEIRGGTTTVVSAAPRSFAD